jgi:uncharacterized membrane protein
MLIMDAGLTVDWTKMPTYNTIMSVAAGAGMLTILSLGRRLSRRQLVSYEGYAVTFGVLGLILTITGAHMTLTWPFAKYFPFDNIIFGEPSLAFGVLLLGGAVLLWRRRTGLHTAGDPARSLADAVAPLSIFVFGLGLSLGAIAIAGLVFQLFAAPPEEPITGTFAQWPWVEATFMSGLFGFAGIGALLFPFAAARFTEREKPSGLEWATAVFLGLSGLAFLLFGALNFFTHIGLVINTMPS